MFDKSLRVESTFLAVLILTLLSVLLWFNHQDNERLVKLQSGEYTLVCLFKDGERVVQPSQIVDVVDSHHFVFKNGSATNCHIIKPMEQ